MMRIFVAEEHTEFYAACRSIIGSERWARLIRGRMLSDDPASLLRDLIQAGEQGMPKFLPDLARLESAIEDIRASEDRIPDDIREICLNPAVRLIDLSWNNLLPLLTRGEKETHGDPEPGRELVLVWKDPRVQRVKYRVVSQGDLLAMKIVEERIDPEKAADEGNVSIGFIDAILDEAIEAGILLSPPSQIRRDPSLYSANKYVDESFLTSHSFTLQWHITQACDLHCRH